MRNLLLVLAAVVLLVGLTGDAEAQCRRGRVSCINNGNGAFFATQPVFLSAPGSFGFVNVNQNVPFGAFVDPRFAATFDPRFQAFGGGFNPFFVNNGFAFSNRNFAFGFGGFNGGRRFGRCR